jgi:hypothetical protein
MALIRATHELHARRKGRNVGLGLLLAGFVAIVFGMTVVKVTRGDPMEAFDHVARPALERAAGERPAP